MGKKEQNLRQTGQRQVTVEAKSRGEAPLWAMSGRVRASESTFAQCLSSGEVLDDRHRCTSSFFRKAACTIGLANILCTHPIRENENLNQYVIHGSRQEG